MGFPDSGATAAQTCARMVVQLRAMMRAGTASIRNGLANCRDSRGDKMEVSPGKSPSKRGKWGQGSGVSRLRHYYFGPFIGPAGREQDSVRT